MRVSLSASLADIASLLPDATVVGTCDQAITGLAGLNEAGPTDLSFLANPKYAPEVAHSKAGVILVPAKFQGTPPEGQAWVRVKNPSLALAILCELVEKLMVPPPTPGVHPSAVIDPTAKVHPTAAIGPLCVVEAGAEIGPEAHLVASVYVGPKAKIGAATRLYPQVTIQRFCEVGARCILHSGVVIGADGFGYESTAEGHYKVPQIGNVVIEDLVEMGANSAVDRARFASTRIGRGTKIDNLVQIGHNVTIGQHCFICALVGVSGSTKIGNYVVLAGQVGMVGHIELGDYTQVGGQAGISKSWPAKSKITGSPAMEFRAQRRMDALQRRLPELFTRITDLESRLGITPTASTAATPEND